MGQCTRTEWQSKDNSNIPVDRLKEKLSIQRQTQALAQRSKSALENLDKNEWPEEIKNASRAYHSARISLADSHDIKDLCLLLAVNKIMDQLYINTGSEKLSEIIEQLNNLEASNPTQAGSKLITTALTLLGMVLGAIAGFIIGVVSTAGVGAIPSTVSGAIYGGTIAANVAVATAAGTVVGGALFFFGLRSTQSQHNLVQTAKELVQANQTDLAKIMS